MNSSNNNILRAFRVRVALFLVAVVIVLIVFSVVYRGINTINRLDAVESERDQWQRPVEVVQALGLREGNVVMDLGSGAGYFSLKLSKSVGPNGHVIAVDIRRLSLLFLWIRTKLRSLRNVTVIHAYAEQLSVRAGSLDALLIANTYHELSNRKVILDHAFTSLMPGGRLVVLDRSPSAADVQHDSHEREHELAVATVESELVQAGFEIASRQDDCAVQPGVQSWWLIVARRP